jgi:uncharacterized membrane protein required for colicin V production
MMGCLMNLAISNAINKLRFYNLTLAIDLTMSEIVNQSLQKIAKGTGIIFIGTIIGMLLGFAGRVIIARFLFLFHSEGGRRKNDADI